MADLAFCLFKYFPYGGLQQDFLRLTRVCLARGHRIKIFTGSWQGKELEGLEVHLLSPRGITNHRRAESFSKILNKQPYIHSCKVVVGFNKIPGLDIYFASDSCFASRASSRVVRPDTPPCSSTMMAM